MGTLTFAELKDEVKRSMTNRSDLDTRLGRFLNLGQQRLARMHDFDEMEIISRTNLVYNSTDSDRFLQMPTLREIYSIVLIDGANSRKLVGRTPTYMDRFMPKPEYWARNWPRDYCSWGTYLEFFPMPMAAYEVRMRWTQWPLDMVNETDVSQYNQKDEILIELALSYAYRSLGKEDDAAKHEAFAKGLIADAKETDRTHPDRNISAAPSDGAAAGSVIPTPWANAFVRDTDT